MKTRTGRISLLSLIVVLLLTGCWGQQPGEALAPISAPVEAAPLTAAWPTDEWQTAAPESQGMDGEQLAQMLVDIDQQHLNLHSLLVICNGYLVTETYLNGYDQTREHELFTITKSFIATLIGIAMDQGLITRLDQEALTFFPEKSFEDIDNLKQTRRSSIYSR